MGLEFVSGIGRGVRYAFRGICRNPGFAAIAAKDVAILTAPEGAMVSLACSSPIHASQRRPTPLIRMRRVDDSRACA